MKVHEVKIPSQAEQMVAAMTSELKAWGWWVQLDDSKRLQYPSSEPYAKDLKQNYADDCYHARPDITEERATEIDKAMTLFDDASRQIMRYHFVCGAPSRMVSEWMNKLATKRGSPERFNKDKVARIIESNVSILAGMLLVAKKPVSKNKVVALCLDTE